MENKRSRHVQAALVFGTSKLSQQCIAIGLSPGRATYLELRRLSRILAKEVMLLERQLAEEMKKKQHMIGVHFKFEDEVDRLDAEVVELKLKLENLGK